MVPQYQFQVTRVNGSIEYWKVWIRLLGKAFSVHVLCYNSTYIPLVRLLKIVLWGNMTSVTRIIGGVNLLILRRQGNGILPPIKVPFWWLTSAKYTLQYLKRRLWRFHGLQSLVVSKCDDILPRPLTYTTPMVCFPAIRALLIICQSASDPAAIGDVLVGTRLCLSAYW